MFWRSWLGLGGLKAGLSDTQMAAERRLRTKRGARITADLLEDYGAAYPDFRNSVEMVLRIIELERRERANAHS